MINKNILQTKLLFLLKVRDSGGSHPDADVRDRDGHASGRGLRRSDH